MVTPDRPQRVLPSVAAVTTAPGFVFRNATVVSGDLGIGTREDTDVLVVGDSIADVGRSLNVPEGTVEIDSRGGIVMPGMIDTHRHMWQSVMRGFGADWTLTNYFYFYYLEWGHAFRPEEVYGVSRVGATCCAGRWPSTFLAIQRFPRDRPSPWPASWTRG